MARCFRALGTYVHLATRNSAREDLAVSIARRLLADVDRTCSRFREDSDLTLANTRAGRWTEVDPMLALAVSVALDVAAGTEGLV
ncbi:MAG: FAD:protein FMN transferase, partial [Nocardioides sp.]